MHCNLVNLLCTSDIRSHCALVLWNVTHIVAHRKLEKHLESADLC